LPVEIGETKKYQRCFAKMLHNKAKNAYINRVDPLDKIRNCKTKPLIRTLERFKEPSHNIDSAYFSPLKAINATSYSLINIKNKRESGINSLD
jgi:hypothetical protein